MRFELIDSVLDQSDQKIVAIKNVTTAEEHLSDHFPDFPVLPGVMMLETLVQAARRLLGDNGHSGPFVLAEVRNIRYGNMVRPGEQLRVEVELSKTTEDQFTFKGTGFVNDATAVQGRFSLRTLNVAG